MPNKCVQDQYNLTPVFFLLVKCLKNGSIYFIICSIWKHHKCLLGSISKITLSKLGQIIFIVIFNLESLWFCFYFQTIFFKNLNKHLEKVLYSSRITFLVLIMTEHCLLLIHLILPAWGRYQLLLSRYTNMETEVQRAKVMSSGAHKC